MTWRRIQIWPKNALVCSFQGGHSMQVDPPGAPAFPSGPEDRMMK
jgi:hypothetical protein|eukprot:COSAG06_NODE_5543_length_3415_cov_5.172799_4_plen_45_part_00